MKADHRGEDVFHFLLVGWLFACFLVKLYREWLLVVLDHWAELMLLLLLMVSQARKHKWEGGFWGFRATSLIIL